LTKLFYNCLKLEEVNISNFNEVGDDEVRVLALNAPNLFTFVARDTPLVSDESLMMITQNCPDIDVIDISRSQFASRISDVSLLAMSQKTPTLRVLRIPGCSNITDVGLTWLAEGCKTLEELDLSGLVKVRLTSAVNAVSIIFFIADNRRWIAKPWSFLPFAHSC
jgi:hypothetical protein